MKQHVARKRFGQNFLVDQQVIADIVNAVAPQRDACVVEIGPGLGALTDPLLQRLDRLHVVESKWKLQLPWYLSAISIKVLNLWLKPAIC